MCICTYKRPDLLTKLLKALETLETEDLFTYSVVIADNDEEMSAEKTVKIFSSKSNLKIKYYSVPEKSFSLTRNKTIENSTGEYLAFIDDDEYPDKKWLLNLYKNIKKHNVTAVLGPVIPDYEIAPSKWLLKSALCDRNRFVTGTFLDLKNTRTGNVLFNREIFKDKSNYFNPDYGKLGGEDVALFSHLKDNGHKFIWCDEAAVFEFVPVSRMQLNYHIKRAILRGYTSYYRVQNNLSLINKIKILGKSLLAIIIYIILLPIFLIFSFYRFIKYGTRLIEHATRILTMFKIVKLKNRNF